ncbi:MAG: FG-GAP-like repeat-containing protein [Bacteroidota bacterium]
MRHLVKLTLLFMLGGQLAAQPYFTDVSTQSGVEIFGLYRGVAVGDYNNDGWEDLLFTGFSGATRLLRNEGDMTFSDQTELLGLLGIENFSAGIWADLDNDGDADLILGGSLEPSKVYRNDGGNFVDLTQSCGVGVEGRVLSLNVADVDNDGWLDVYFAELNGRNAFFRNQGDWTFVDETVARNMTDDQISMGAIFTDYNQDGAIDLYLTHDGDQPNIMLQNDGQGYFTNVSLATATNVAANGMGVDVADLDGDGWLDIYITNLYENNLLRNLGGDFFLDRSIASGTQDLGMGWGIVALDVDLDGDQDIYVGNETNFNVGGIYYDNILYLNEGALNFSIADPMGAWASSRGTYGVASADLDRDGDLDLILANSSTGCELLRNDTSTDGHWLSFSLEGVESNRDAAGARVTVTCGEQSWTDELHLGASFASQTSKQLHFGLGSSIDLAKVTVFWPSGQVDSIADLSLDQHYDLVEGEGLVSSVEELGSEDVFLAPNPASDWVNFSASIWQGEASAKLRWWSIDGQLMAQDQLVSGTTRIPVPSSLNPGTYLVEIETAQKIRVQRIIVF